MPSAPPQAGFRCLSRTDSVPWADPQRPGWRTTSLMVAVRLDVGTGLHHPGTLGAFQFSLGRLAQGVGGGRARHGLALRCRSNVMLTPSVQMLLVVRELQQVYAGCLRRLSQCLWLHGAGCRGRRQGPGAATTAWLPRCITKPRVDYESSVTRCCVPSAMAERNGSCARVLLGAV